MNLYEESMKKAVGRKKNKNKPQFLVCVKSMHERETKLTFLIESGYVKNVSEQYSEKIEMAISD